MNNDSLQVYCCSNIHIKCTGVTPKVTSSLPVFAEMTETLWSLLSVSTLENLISRFHLVSTFPRSFIQPEEGFWPDLYNALLISSRSSQQQQTGRLTAPHGQRNISVTGHIHAAKNRRFPSWLLLPVWGGLSCRRNAKKTSYQGWIHTHFSRLILISAVKLFVISGDSQV